VFVKSAISCLLFILESIILARSIYTGNTNYFSLAFSILLFIGFLSAKNYSKSAGIIGILVGIFYCKLKA
jgi:hypothetical protein